MTHTADDHDGLGNIRRLIRDAAPTLLIQTGNGAYPYEVTERMTPPTKFSASTNAMVAHCLACIGDMLPGGSRLVGFQLLPDRDRIVNVALRDCAHKAVRRLVDEIQLGKDDKSVFSSSAFGQDDPFTIGWVLELLDGAVSWNLDCDEKDIESAHRRARSVAIRRVREALKAPGNAVLRLTSTSERAVLHPLPLLRTVQLANLLEATTDQSFADLMPEVFEWFLTHLHLQLSRRSIQHSGFDIAELIFCLEGMLAAGHSRVTRSILESVIGALNEARQLNSTLRATTPFKVTSVGAVHLFTSVEVVSSLLRCTVLLDRYDRSGFFTELKPTLRHYLSWLQATMLRGRATLHEKNNEAKDPYPPDVQLEFAGWHSEHAHTDDNSVHVWITSQILLFLRAYETLLSNDIAEAALRATGIQLEGRTTLQPAAEAPISQLRQAARHDDPLQLSEHSPYRIRSRLTEWFVEPRLNGTTTGAAYSCLLYGPPGTGKTTLARRVAMDLGWPLLTITTSDFIIDGEAQVEARAKHLFQTLLLQSGIVIFFDEIDRLLMDRDMPSYTQQGDMLQFMTPSMLTKINDLRQAERCIFVIGTNYADRIDRAIKRAGRIDHKFLVLPPDLKKRTDFLKTELEQLLGGPGPSADEIEEAARAGAGQTIAELRSAVRNFARGGDSLEQQVKSVVPVLSLATYNRRLRSLDALLPEIVTSNSELLEEAYMAAYLMSEVAVNASSPDFTWLGENWVGVRDTSVIPDSDVVAKLDTFFR